MMNLDASVKSVEGIEQKDSSADAIKAVLPLKEPRYLLFTFVNPKNEKESKVVFGYYCPDKADRKLKFTYSTAKTNVVDFITTLDIQVTGKV